jgi:O-antigen/teichoic acid export membrane protein
MFPDVFLRSMSQDFRSRTRSVRGQFPDVLIDADIHAHQVTTPQATQPTLRRAVILMTASSFLIPAAGVLTQPILAQALGVDGRGELAAAIAPAVLAVSVATLGLPDALTFYLAKYPSFTRRAMLWTSLVTVGLGLLCLLVTVGALPFLSAGDDVLGNLIVLGIALTIPALVIGVLRGAATGRQMWNEIARERLINTVLRIVAFVVLLVLGHLTVLTALLVSCLSPIIAGVVYWRLLLPVPRDDAEPPLGGGMVRTLLSFGCRVWFGAVASMLLARIGQILMVPLSSVGELGLYSVASTIADLPLIVAIAIQGTLYGVNSKSNDAAKLTATTRITLLVGAVGCTVLGASVPLWIGLLFGQEFTAATVPTLMLMFSALLCIPGLMAATAVAAWGRPGLRSIGLGVTLVVNVIAFVLLVPPLGVIGACWTSILSNVILSGYMIIVAGRVMKVPAGDFVRVRASDIALLRREGARLLEKLPKRGGRVAS